MSGYVYCAHLYCFAIIVGQLGDLCDDCAAQTDLTVGQLECEGCDNDSTDEVRAACDQLRHKGEP